MSREDEFDGLAEMVDADDFRAAQERTVGVVETFSSLMHIAVEKYPQGDLYEFLADQTTLFALCVMLDGMVSFDNVGDFFVDCGFDGETVFGMMDDYWAVKGLDDWKTVGVVEALDIWRKALKEVQ